MIKIASNNTWSISSIGYLHNIVSVVGAEDKTVRCKQRHLILTSSDPRDLPMIMIVMSLVKMMIIVIIISLVTMILVSSDISF